MQNTVTLFDRHESAMVKTQKQQRLVTQYSLPLITLSTFMPDHMVHTPAAKQLFHTATQALQNTLKELNYHMVKTVSLNHNAGDEALFIISGPSATELKRAMIKLEKTHPLGSLINLDVMNKEGKTISRHSCEMEPRKCMICGGITSKCAARHKHSAAQQEQKIMAMMASLREESKEPQYEEFQELAMA